MAGLVIRNGRFATGDTVSGRAEAVAIDGGRFIAVGSEREVLAQCGPDTRTIDLGGRLALPGLNDSHLHLIRGGLNYNMELRWDGVPSLADALRRLREQAKRTPPPQ